jgi:hypothetical protein
LGTTLYDDVGIAKLHRIRHDATNHISSSG